MIYLTIHCISVLFCWFILGPYWFVKGDITNVGAYCLTTIILAPLLICVFIFDMMVKLMRFFIEYKE
jgi:hypothetical protein